MIRTDFESKVKIQQIIDNQLPNFIRSESPKTVDFLKQYYISQEYQGGPVDITDNLNQYLSLDSLIPEVIVDSTTLSYDIDSTVGVVTVSSTKGFPQEYGLFKINDEVITYTNISSDNLSFEGCKRGFSGITSYHQELNDEELVFSSTTASEHSAGSHIQNLSSLFLKEFYKKLKFNLVPGLEDIDFTPTLNVGAFLKESRSFYESKGTNESFRILFNVLYNETPRIVNLEDYLIKPSSAEYLRREVVVAEVVNERSPNEDPPNPKKLVGQTLFKTSDLNTNAAISEIEPFSRIGVALTSVQQYFKISLFVGYDNSASTIQGDFKITPSTRSLNAVSIGSSVITVDSTIGFGQTGTLISGSNTNINYTNKSVNQFFGCTGIDNGINSTDNIRNNDTYFGYEDGDTTKKVELRLTGVLSEFEQVSDNLTVDEGEIISVKNLGDLIKNPSSNKTYKETFANSWIYNTSTRYKIKIEDTEFGEETQSINLFDSYDRSSLKQGDTVEIVERSSNNITLFKGGDSFAIIIEDNNSGVGDKQVLLSSKYTPVLNKEYDLRRKINTAISNREPLEYDDITSDIQNVYIENEETFYVASNSLPSAKVDGNGNEREYQYLNSIDTKIDKVSIPLSHEGFGLIEEISGEPNKFAAIKFENNVPFQDGDEIFYKTSGDPYGGLENNEIYFVEVDSSDKKIIKLYTSPTFIGSSDYIKLSDANAVHEFILTSQSFEKIGAQKLLKKFPVNPDISKGNQTKTVVGTTGMLVNGVEINNYKSNDKIYYGPIDSIKLLNGGSDYDVINLPKIEVAAGFGTTALIQPIIQGNIKKVYVDQQNFDINEVISINVTGGNGNAVLEPIIQKRSRDVLFSGLSTNSFGGVSQELNTIQFLSDHVFEIGQEVIYNSGGSKPVSVGIGTSTLVDDASYFVEVIDEKTVKLYTSFDDAISKTNVVGLNTFNAGGIHKFSTLPTQKYISGIGVINDGLFTNRKLIVKSTGISTQYDKVTFNNHGFNNGEKIIYSTTGNKISGLNTSTGITTTTNQYQIIKIDDNSFRLSDAGVGGTITSNYTSKNYISLNSVGSGNHNFSYPDIEVSLDYVPLGIGTDTQIKKSVKLTPIIRGSIIDSYLYESGTGYGSSIINFEKNPIISIKNGKNASLKPTIVNGKIDAVSVSFQGSEYFSIPDLNIIDNSGSGTGAELRPIISNGKLTDVEIINAGIGYSSSDTSINVVAAGKNAVISNQIRSLTLDNRNKFGDSILLNSNENNNLQYGICGYGETLRDYFGDSIDLPHSPIIGWAYDGNPIYGSFGYANPGIALTPTRMRSGYTLNSSKVIDRPLGFDDGYFVEDYEFTNAGDLDRNNGRFTKTFNFPDGIYAYFATIKSDSDQNIPEFPYFIGDSYRSVPVLQDIDQSYNFEGSNLIRNTFPYKISEKNIDNDFIVETNEISKQKIVMKSVTSGSVDELVIISSGDNYKVNTSLSFDNTNTEGTGLISRVTSLKGKDIVDINTTTTTFNNTIINWKNSNSLNFTVLPFHTFSDGDVISISGFASTLSQLNGNHTVGVTSFKASGISTILPSSTVGFTTEIYVSSIPESVSVGNSIGIGTETLQILDIYKNANILRVERGTTGLAHTVPFTVSFLPDTFTINKSVDYFESRINDIVYFNPKESIGFGTLSGISSSVTFDFGVSTITRDIPTQRIYIENHPFVDNQQITLSNVTSNITYNVDPSNSANSNASLPSTLFVSNTSKNTIGIKTGVGIGYSNVYFVSGGADVDTYKFTSNYEQILVDVEKNVAKVSVSTSHNLKIGDNISLSVNPNLSVGIGTSSSVKIQLDENTGYSLVNHIGFNSTGINTTTNQINISSHGFITGDKISYTTTDTAPEGLSVNDYFVYKVDKDNFKLCNTRNDAISNPPITISIASTGGESQTIFSINPQIDVVDNNNLVFDLSHSSLQGYKFKLYYDKDFNNEFVSTSSTTFNIISVGTPGISADASIKINNNNLLPEKLYYTFEKSGFISTADKDVQYYSEIEFIESSYNNDYSIIGIGNTTFDISLKLFPEKISYNQSECDSLIYSTSSLTASGGIDKVGIDYGGSGYKKLPNFVGTSSTEGKGGQVIAKSKSIGNANQIRIINEGFEYSSDNTLKPNAFISPFITINNSNTIGVVTVSEPGSGYLSSPNINLVDSITREKINKGVFNTNLVGSSIKNIDITIKPFGLSDNPIDIFTTNNSNGVGIKTIISNSTGIFTCSIETPSLGFTAAPFLVGDEVFIEGIKKYSTDGSGFNSEDYGFKFFKVSSFDDTGINFKVTINLEGLSTNTGIAITNQNSLASIVNKNKYPIFTTLLESSKFIIGEQLIIGNEQKDLFITSSESDFIKITGNYELSIGDIITGKESGVIATIDSISNNNGRYIVDYSAKKDIGWSDNIGKLNDDTQVIPNNDYYQNLSYSIQSSLTYDKLRNAVNSLLHTSGLKNFADTGISSSTTVGIAGTDFSIVIKDYIGDNRIDSIYNFDLANSLNENDISKFITLQNKKLSNYNLSKSNEVFVIDNINTQFNNLTEDTNEYLDVFNNNVISYKNLLLRVSNLQNTKVQLSDLVLLSNNNNQYLLERGQLVSGITTSYGSEDLLGSFDLIENIFTGEQSVRFVPLTDTSNTDYDIKVITSEFLSGSGIGTFPVGFINLSGISGIGTSNNDGTPAITGIITAKSDKFTSFHTRNELINKTKNEVNFVEVYATHDGTNTYVSEYFIDNSNYNGYSSTGIGSFKANISGSDFVLNYHNDTTDQIDIKSNVVGFGTTSVGTATYRFNKDNQPDGTERTAIYQSNYSKSIGISTVFTLDKNLFNAVKSIIEVSIGSTKALHQVLTVHNGDNVYVNSLPFLSVNGTIPNSSIEEYDNILGIGTFGVNFASNDFLLKFYPDPIFNSDYIQVSTLNLCVYKKLDVDNKPNDFIYGKTKESIDNYFYNAPNGSRINRTSFTLTSNDIPLFAKTFDPANTDIISTNGNTFNIEDHFFRTNEELIYTPKSTFVGVGSTPMQYQGVTGGIDILPSNVFAIRTNKDSFQISTTSGGGAVTFVGVGTGNGHEFAMAKSNTKNIININNIIQSPLSFALLTHTLKDNFDDNNSFLGISTSRTTFALSGISSVRVRDILKIDNEYMNVVSVGVGTTTVGPITPGIGLTSLVDVERGFVGTSATNHTNNTNVEIYRGSFNIVGSKIHFVDAPRGNLARLKNENNLDFARSDFNGRTYFRQNYTTNQIYDDISEQFTGIGQTFNLTIGGSNTSGIGETGGNGLVLINSIFQRPTAVNNPSNNYQMIDDSVAGVSSISFTGIRSDTGDIFISENDVNQNQLPRGGVIISLGSTPGLGYAPLEGAEAITEIDATGGISRVVSAATTGPSNNITTARYDNLTGDIVITTKNDHNFELGIVNQVKLVGLEFSCTQEHAGVTTTIFPDVIDPVTGLGTTAYTILQTIPGDFEHRFVTATDNAVNGSLTPTGALYKPTSGLLELSFSSAHNLSIGDAVTVANYGITFTCDADNHATTHPYPRPTDPISGISVPVLDVPTTTSFTINVGPSPTYRFKTNVGICTIPHNYVGQGTVFPYYGDVKIGSGYRSPVSVAVTDTAFNHKFVGTIGTSVFVNSWSGVAKTATGADYDSVSGNLILTIPSHGLTDSNTVGIKTESLIFSCSKDNYKTEHLYPRATDPVSGILTAITAYDTNTFTVNVGSAIGRGAIVNTTVGLGGTLSFSIGAAGTNYKNPQLIIPEASYKNLEVTGVSRLADGSTTNTGSGLLLDINIGASSTVGIGSTQFSVTNWKIARNGYGFRKGDVFTPVGLVTDASLSSPIKQFELTVSEAYNDPFSAWQFGQFDYIDSIKDQQDGVRTRFEIKYDDEYLNFEIEDGGEFNVNLSNSLLIIINGVVQEPGSAYQFEGGTSFVFTEPPKEEDDVAIFFYRGTSGEDTLLVDTIKPTLKSGDDLQLLSIDSNDVNQDNRTMLGIATLTSGDVETVLYDGVGINDNTKSLKWTKQKSDKIINGELVYKSRPMLEPLIFPTAKIIGDISSSALTSIFVDDVDLFDNENEISSKPIGGIIIDNSVSPVSAALTAIVSTGGTISSIVIGSGGTGYTPGTIPISIGIPTTGIEVGVGTTATATATISSNGEISSVSITNPGLGYNQNIPPKVLAPFPTFKSEKVLNIDRIHGFSGIITGIGTVTGIGVPLALEFILKDGGTYENLVAGYPINIHSTTIGSGATSIYDANDKIVGIGTTFLDNVYNVSAWNQNVGIITCNIHSDSPVVGLGTTGSTPVGKVSWGRLFSTGSITRGSNPISIGVTGFTITSGLTTFPTIQRRVQGLRDTGAIEPS
tara:strand:- start:21595 stop:34593 length:12999 start_codon:yes stop_codon:yes gene_type:complete